jgi:hypothetical protein
VKISPSTYATQLYGKWARISRLHIGLGQGCICNINNVTLEANDFEQDISEYIFNKYSHNEHFNKWIVEQDNLSLNTNGIILEILKKIAISPPSKKLAIEILEDIDQTISSFERVHSG